MDYNLSNEYIGNRIRKLRKGKKIEAVQMAEYLSISRNQLSLIERGISSISVEKFLKVCSKLETSPDDVLGICKDGQPAIHTKIIALVDQLTEEQQVSLIDFLTTMLKI